MKKYLAEFLGTLLLVLIACGTAAALACSATPNAAYLLTALAFGLVLTALCYSIGNVSGCHVNPAVSLAMLISKKLKPLDFVGYVIAQFAGAIAGAAIIGYLLGWDCSFGANALFEADVLKSFVIEGILTFVFVFAILGVTAKSEHSSVSGLVIGLSLTVVHIFGIYFTGTSVNPARSFGPALFVGGDALSNVWVFLLAPFVGGALAAFVWRFLFIQKIGLKDRQKAKK